MKLNSIRLVSWDIDGTLYSVRRMKWHLLHSLAREIANGRGLAATRELKSLQRYRALIHNARSAGGVLEDSSLEEFNRDALLETEMRWFGPAIQRAGLHSGVTDLLSILAKRGIPQVVLSDYHAAYKLGSLGLKDRFAAVYEGERLGFVKPSPKIFERIAADFGVPLATLLHIGDRADTDGLAALAAGCQCLILGRDFRNFHSLSREFRSAVG